MRKICNWYEFKGYMICKNFGGWVVVDGYDYNIYKALSDARNAISKRHDGTHKAEPRVIGTMTNDQFIHALN